MKTVIEAIRKYDGEEYLFNLEVPTYEGETGIFGIECDDVFYVESPDNGWGYKDIYVYDPKDKRGHWQDRYHPKWITRKIKETCDRLYTKYEREQDIKFFRKVLPENGIKITKSMRLEKLENLYYDNKIYLNRR